MRRRKKTVASKVGAAQGELSRKIAKVRGDSPLLTAAQAAGKAAGILAGKHGRRFRVRKGR